MDVERLEHDLRDALRHLRYPDGRVRDASLVILGRAAVQGRWGVREGRALTIAAQHLSSTGHLASIYVPQPMDPRLGHPLANAHLMALAPELAREVIWLRNTAQGKPHREG